jgi:hypothetical protein
MPQGCKLIVRKAGQVGGTSTLTALSLARSYGSVSDRADDLATPTSRQQGGPSSPFIRVHRPS